MAGFKSVDFFSRISDYVVIFKDREVAYHGLKEVEKRPSTKVVFRKGKYTCTDKYVYGLILGGSMYKAGKIIEVKDVNTPTASNGLVFKKSTLARMSKDDLIDLVTQMKLVVVGKKIADEPVKDDYVDAVLSNQENTPAVEAPKVPTAAKGAMTAANSISIDPSISVPAPEVG